MMHFSDGWMGGEVWLWTVVGVLVVSALVVVMVKLSRR